MLKEYPMKPWVYDIVFSIEKVVENGTLDESSLVPMEIDNSREREKGDMHDEEARVTKKQKSVETCPIGKVNDFPAVILTKQGTVVMREYHKVIILRNERYSELP
jgi:hypothetical protein